MIDSAQARENDAALNGLSEIDSVFQLAIGVQKPVLGRLVIIFGKGVRAAFAKACLP